MNELKNDEQAVKDMLNKKEKKEWASLKQETKEMVSKKQKELEEIYNKEVAKKTKEI